MQLINYDRKLDLLQKFSKTNVQQKKVKLNCFFCTMLGVTTLSVNRSLTVLRELIRNKSA